ncbi:MAG TPA: 3-dehydroquinate synthase [Aggregatilineaceae bacterium]|nr:3-dehydroquinate synthase [Aggregatilineaceae bacterium]
MAAEPLTIRGAEGVYPVIVREGALTDALPHFVAERGFSRVAVITNTTLAPLYGAALVGRLPGGYLVSVPDGEQHKTLETMHSIYAQLLDCGADRGTLIVALGGGVIGDMAGFAAATFMRGVALVQAPTSLLAMVDASLGGKVGVDLPQGKNLVGAFKDPLAVFADTSTLRTLPEVEFRCGLAEVIKAALVGDPPLLDHLLAHGAEPVAELIARAAAVKVRLVEQDRLEKGPRAYLNLGHTFAHAIEQVSGYTWKHGEAVAVGMVAAARLSEWRELCSPGLAAHVARALAAFGLPVYCTGFEPGDLWDAMRHDKKWRDGAVRLVLLGGIGEPVIVDDASRDEVIAVLDGLREGT